jgi:molybdopterin-guanine dinucleotide biosynthesis protein A
VLVVATDLPALSASLLLALVAAPEADCVAPRREGGLEPLCALYRRGAVLAPARAAWAAGSLSLRELLAGVRLVALEGPELALVADGGRALANLNTREDLEAFRASARCATME